MQQAYSNLQQGRELIQSQEKNVEQATEALRLASARLGAGAGTQLEVLDARVQLTTAQSTKLQALYTYNTAVAEFDRVTATEIAYSTKLDEPGTRGKLRTDPAPTPAPKPTPLELNGPGAAVQSTRTTTTDKSRLRNNDPPLEQFPALQRAGFTHAFVGRVPGVDIFYDKTEVLSRLDHVHHTVRVSLGLEHSAFLTASRCMAIASQ